MKCGGEAQDWAYDHTDPTELIGESARLGVVAYSVWEEFYMPMCRRCHSVFDHGGSVTENEDW